MDLAYRLQRGLAGGGMRNGALLAAFPIVATLLAACVAPAPPSPADEPEVIGEEESPKTSPPSEMTPERTSPPPAASTAPPDPLSHPATPPPSCAAGKAVYAFSQGSRWRYSTASAVPSG